MDNAQLHPKMYIYRRLVEAKLYIDQSYSEKIDLEQISNQAHFSKYHFQRLFKDAFGKSPHQYLTHVRLFEAEKLLKNGHSVSDVCIQVGFDSLPSFTNLFKKKMGIPPSDYSEKARSALKQQAQTPLAFIPNCFIHSNGWDK